MEVTNVLVIQDIMMIIQLIANHVTTHVKLVQDQHKMIVHNVILQEPIELTTQLNKEIVHVLMVSMIMVY